METNRLNPYKAAPEAMKALGALEARIAASGLEKPLVELVRLRASQVNGCAFCLDVHSRDARKAGVDERRLATLAAWADTPFFSERERAALEWTESLTLIAQTHAPDASWERVRAQFTPEEIVDLTLLVGAINVWNRIGIAFRKHPA